MIQVIDGKKGSGKTKRILDMANHMVDTQHGDVVFVDDDNRYMFDLRHEVRFVNAGEYGIRSADMFFGFLAGMLATNFDVKVIFIDAFLKLRWAGSLKSWMPIPRRTRLTSSSPSVWTPMICPSL